MEGPCDFAIHLSRGYEIANPCFKSRDVGVIAVAAHIAPDLVLADGTGLPDDPDPDLAALGPLIEDDLFHDEPKDLLALDHARRIPQFGKILTQRDNLSAVRRGKRYRLLAANSRIQCRSAPLAGACPPIRAPKTLPPGGSRVRRHHIDGAPAPPHSALARA